MWVKQMQNAHMARFDVAIFCVGVVSDSEPVISNIWTSHAWNIFKKNKRALQSQYHPSVAACQYVTDIQSCGHLTWLVA